RAGYIYEIGTQGIRSASGQAIVHPVAYYTLNQIPAGERIASKTVDASTVFETVHLQSHKRVTEMPGSWLDGPDQTVEIGTLPGMRYDTDEISIKAGSKIKWVFNNPDDMMHNLLIVQPGTADQVGNTALQLGLKGQEKGFIPESDEVLFHTNLLEPNSSDVIYFTAPIEPGEYMFVCTFPGHAATMRGVLRVEPKT
ncbi:MAG: plastocyanin/azurin family copper-binding protein, partial [Saprospiraceae bacterium]|nr:plastocyanin/azurin family copper-binding protein [Saprospiraceae bacterium]